MKKVNVLILGSGGREHAISWKIKQSPLLNKLFVAPGNSGTLEIAKNIEINILNYIEIKKTILDHKIDLLIIGPEEPIVNGLHDKLISDIDMQDLIVIGPQKMGAKLEGSKSFAKDFMTKNKIPTAQFKTFNIKERNEIKTFLLNSNSPYVIKMDGLAAGKGVFICETFDEAMEVVDRIKMEKMFGAAGEKIIIEEFLVGIELSVFILTDGQNYKLLPMAKDYKRIGDGDTGLNTGGMGAVSPLPFVNKTCLKKIKDKIILPTLKGLKNENIQYTGFIFFGLILVGTEPYVIEYNIRLGDPETQVILPRLESDLLELFLNINNRDLFAELPIIIKNEIATTITVASGGYPEKYKKNLIVHGIKTIQDSIIFHAGLKLENKEYRTNGGRVLNMTSLADNFQSAITKSYNNIKNIHFENLYFRNDIGKDIFK